MEGQTPAGCLPTCASRWRVVLWTGSLSYTGSTVRPNVSTASIATSTGIVVESMPNVSWSAPVSTHFWQALSHSSGEPISTAPSLTAISSISTDGSGIVAGQSGTYGGFGNVSR